MKVLGINPHFWSSASFEVPVLGVLPGIEIRKKSPRIPSGRERVVGGRLDRKGNCVRIPSVGLTRCWSQRTTNTLTDFRQHMAAKQAAAATE